MTVSRAFTFAPGPTANSTGLTPILKLGKVCFHVEHMMLTVYVPCWTACVSGTENVYSKASLAKMYAVQSLPMLMVKEVSAFFSVDFAAQPAMSKRKAMAIQRLMERMRPPLVKCWEKTLEAPTKQDSLPGLRKKGCRRMGVVFRRSHHV